MTIHLGNYTQRSQTKLSSRAYPDFLLHRLHRRPLMWFSLKRTTCSRPEPQLSTGNLGKPRDLRCAPRASQILESSRRLFSPGFSKKALKRMISVEFFPATLKDPVATRLLRGRRNGKRLAVNTGFHFGNGAIVHSNLSRLPLHYEAMTYLPLCRDAQHFSNRGCPG